LFSGDVEQFVWWKNKLYISCFIQGEDICDVIKDGTFVPVDKDGMDLNSKGLNANETKENKKHHKAINILVNAL